MNHILNKLNEFGLDNREAKIYTFLLSNKDLPAYKISKEVKIPRTTTYKILESLEDKGVVSSWNKNNVKHFSAESPDNLKTILSNKQEALNDIFDELKEKFGIDKNNPKTRILTGKEGVKTAFNHILETMVDNKIKVVYVFSEPQLTELIPKFFLKWRDEKNRKTKAFTKMIVPPGVSSYKNYSSDEFRETREMPEKYSSVGSVDIIGDNVYFFSFKEGEVYSVIIESSIVAEMYTNMFKYIWDTLDTPTT